MLVVADSSPLIALINVGHVDVLPVLFGQIVVPPEVFAELNSSRRPRAVHEFVDSRPAWLLERAPTIMRRFPVSTLANEPRSASLKNSAPICC